MVRAVGSLCSVLLACLLTIAASQSPLKRGMELSYSGEAKVQSGEQSLAATVQVTDLVTDVQEDKKTVVVSLRVFAPQIEGREIPQEASLRFLDIGLSGEESSVGIEQIAAEVPPFPFTRQFVQILPVYFLPLQRLESGKSWAVKERVFVPLDLEGEIQYTVKGKEKLGDSQCFLVTRTLPKPLPIPQSKEAQFSKIADTLWVDEKTGIVRKIQRETVLQIREGQILTINLQLELKSTKVLDEQTFAQRLKELDAIKSVRQKLVPILSQPSEETLDAAGKAIGEFLQKFPNSPYRPHLETWQRVTEILKRQVQRQQQQGALIGKPAPDFELPTVDSKRKVKLSDLKGKVVVLNFFAHWCGPCNAEAPHLEKEFWQTYKDKGVVVVGVAIWAEGDPFKLAREFIQKHNLTYLVLVDAENKTPNLYNVEGVPTNVVVDKDGKIQYLQAGFDPEGLKKAIEKALK